MTRGLFRIGWRNGTTRVARGDGETGPTEVLGAEVTLEGLLARGAGGLEWAVLSAPAAGPVPPGAPILAPVDSQEVWAAGVTYERSRDARMEESEAASVYDRVYAAARPELFFKAVAWRVRGPGETVGIRADSAWNVPEPELGVVVGADLSIAGYTIGNDLSSRAIEGDNPLYLPQAKVYEGSCALGPCIVPAGFIEPPFEIGLEVARDGVVVVRAGTTTGRLRRPLEELVRYLGMALTFPAGAVLLTGTGIVPEPAFTLLEGDLVRIDVPGLGRLENPVVRVGHAGDDLGPDRPVPQPAAAHHPGRRGRSIRR